VPQLCAKLEFALFVLRDLLYLVVHVLVMRANTLTMVVAQIAKHAVLDNKPQEFLALDLPLLIPSPVLQ